MKAVIKMGFAEGEVGGRPSLHIELEKVPDYPVITIPLDKETIRFILKGLGDLMRQMK